MIYSLIYKVLNSAGSLLYLLSIEDMVLVKVRFHKSGLLTCHRKVANMKDFDKDKTIDILNKIMELELSGVVRYTHYSLMVYGYNRIPIVSWLKGNAQDVLCIVVWRTSTLKSSVALVTFVGSHRHQVDRVLVGELLLLACIGVQHLRK